MSDMEDALRYAVGLDVGTENVRAVVLSVSREAMTVVGYGEAKNSGMRKGVVANLTGPGEAVDRMLLEVERMSDYHIEDAYVSINGSHVTSTKTSGMIAVGANNHEINIDDLLRVEDAAVTGRIPPNRDVLAVLPLDYTLDGQSGIRDPLGMNGVRLEINANVISALMPNCNNLRRAMSGIPKVNALRLIPSVMAAATAVLTERQMENGVAVIDMGAATTSVAVYEEGDLQHLGVIPVGANNITNDLAIMLKITSDAAEDVKLRFVTAEFIESDKDIVLKKGREEIRFSRNEVNEIVKARLTEIFERVDDQLKLAGYSHRLPEGVVIVGGGARMRGIEAFAKGILQTATRLGAPSGLAGVSESVEKTEFSTAVGLALLAAQDNGVPRGAEEKSKGKGLLKNLFSKL